MSADWSGSDNSKDGPSLGQTASPGPGKNLIYNIYYY